MKCEVCQKLLEEYIDSELAEPEAQQVNAHLITCVGCASEFEGLTAEQEIYARYDRALTISPSMWMAIAARTEAGKVIDSHSELSWRDRLAGFFAAPSPGWSFAGGLAILLLVAVIGMAYLRMHRAVVKPDVIAAVNRHETGGDPVKDESIKSTRVKSAVPVRGANHVTSAISKNRLNPTARSKSKLPVNAGANQSDVLFSDVAYSAAEDQETQKHIEQAQNLLRSVRNIEFGEDDTEIDVSYEKALSRQLLNENVVLRRDAEMSGKFPVKTLLSSLEPFLLDIANLPDKTSADDLRVIKERVQKTEIVAALHSF